MRRIGVVTGLASEREVFDVFAADRRPAVRCHGPGPAAATRAARELLAEGCRALISFGVAGGLDPTLPPGRLVLAETIVDADGAETATDAAWRRRLATRLAVASGTAGRLLGSDAPILDVAAKRSLHRRLGACAVDMESLALARVASSAGAPFVAVRAVADPAGRALPAWLANVVDEAGRPHLPAVLAGLLRHPGSLPALLRLAADQRRALRTLRRVALDAGPRLALD